MFLLEHSRTKFQRHISKFQSMNINLITNNLITLTSVSTMIINLKKKRRVKYLVRVERNTGDAIHSEVEKRKRIPGFFHEWNYKSTETGIHVDGYVIFFSQSCDVNDRIHHPMRETRCRSDQLKKVNPR